MIEDERIRIRSDAEPAEDGAYVLYWMQRSQREGFNPALEHALRLANRRDEPVLVGFGLFDRYPDANARHFRFMLEGLAEACEALRRRGIKLVARRGRPDVVALALAKHASIVVCDAGVLRHERRWRRRVAREARRRVVEVEADAVVPPKEASDKREHAARTLRPKIERRMDAFLGGLSPTRPARSSLQLDVTSDVELEDPDAALAALRVDRSVAPAPGFVRGASEARRRLAAFLRHHLDGYADSRPDPRDARVSTLSPYLHFGQISPVEVARKVRDAKSGRREDRQAFLEELVVRRELALNYVLYEPEYDSFSALPEWARETLAAHRDDERPHRYTRRQLERSETHDRYWNAAMTCVRDEGYLHNHLRMYWGKKILEWCSTPEYAFRTLLALNNKYFLDGRDAASYANVAWIFGLHDRGWPERAVFGKVRSMTAAGLERKFEVAAWADEVLGEEAGADER